MLFLFQVHSLDWVSYLVEDYLFFFASRYKLLGMNEMNGVLGHLCETGPGEPLEDGEMNEMTLSSRHRTLNSNPDGLRPSLLLLGHKGSPQY